MPMDDHPYNAIRIRDLAEGDCFVDSLPVDYYRMRTVLKPTVVLKFFHILPLKSMDLHLV